MRRPSRPVVLLTALALAGAVAAAPALSHTSVKSRSPASGSKVSSKQASASVTFNKQVRSGALKVVGPGGRTYSVGKGGRDPRKVTRVMVELDTPLPSGSYKASWTIKAADGHTQRGSWRFRVR